MSVMRPRRRRSGHRQRHFESSFPLNRPEAPPPPNTLPAHLEQLQLALQRRVLAVLHEVGAVALEFDIVAAAVRVRGRGREWPDLSRPVQEMPWQSI